VRVLRGGLLQRDGAAPRVLHVAELRAGAGRDADEVALVRPRRAAAHGRHGEEVLAQLGVVREPARAEHDALACAERHSPPVGRRRLDAGDVRAGEHEPLHAMARMDADARRERRRSQARDPDRAAVGRRLVRLGGHHHASGRHPVLCEVPHVVDELRRVAERQRAALRQQLDGGPGALVDCAVHRDLPLVEAEARVVGDEPLGPRRARAVLEEVLLAVVEPRVAQRPVVRHPDPEARLRRRAAQLRRLLQQHDLVPEPGREQRRAEPGAPAADDHDVGRHVEAHVARGKRGLALRHGLVPRSDDAIRPCVRALRQGPRV
jgi:hypothetical protein